MAQVTKCAGALVLTFELSKMNQHKALQVDAGFKNDLAQVSTRMKSLHYW